MGGRYPREPLGSWNNVRVRLGFVQLNAVQARFTP